MPRGRGGRKEGARQAGWGSPLRGLGVPSRCSRSAKCRGKASGRGPGEGRGRLQGSGTARQAERAWGARASWGGPWAGDPGPPCLPPPPSAALAPGLHCGNRSCPASYCYNRGHCHVSPERDCQPACTCHPAFSDSRCLVAGNPFTPAAPAGTTGRLACAPEGGAPG